MRFEARIKELVENLPDLAALIEPLLIVRRTLARAVLASCIVACWRLSGTMKCAGA